jgi:hypothetical protein
MLHVRIVARAPRQFAITQKIGPRIPDVCDQDLFAVQECTRERGCHAFEGVVVAAEGTDVQVGQLQPSTQLVPVVEAQQTTRDESMDEYRRGDITGRSAADPIGDGDRRCGDERRILVGRAIPARVRDDGGVEAE